MKYFFRGLFFFLLAASFYFSLKQATNNLPDILLMDKVVHFLAYFSLILTLDFSFKSGRSIIWKGMLVILFSSMMEILQSYVPGRDSSMLDIMANISGVIVFLLCVPLLKHHNIYRKLSL